VKTIKPKTPSAKKKEDAAAARCQVSAAADRQAQRPCSYSRKYIYKAKKPTYRLVSDQLFRQNPASHKSSHQQQKTKLENKQITAINQLYAGIQR
jgi:hypothetical protein